MPTPHPRDKLPTHLALSTNGLCPGPAQKQPLKASRFSIRDSSADLKALASSRGRQIAAHEPHVVGESQFGNHWVGARPAGKLWGQGTGEPWSRSPSAFRQLAGAIFSVFFLPLFTLDIFLFSLSQQVPSLPSTGKHHLCTLPLPRSTASPRGALYQVWCPVFYGCHPGWSGWRRVGT